MVLILIILLIALIIGDFKYRYVYIWQLLLFAAVQTTFCLITLGGMTVFQNLLVNGGITLFVSLLVRLYLFFRFRGKKIEAIGWGDIIFIFILTPYFPISTFLYFMIISLLLTLGGWGIFYLMGSKSKDVPLVSTLGICYCVFLIYNCVVA